MTPWKIRSTVLAVLSAVSLLGLPEPAAAASYKKLSASGFKAGPLTKARSGVLGWKVSNGTEAYFCLLRVSMAYVGKTGLVSFTTAGQQITLHRKMFDESMGGPLSYIPQPEDLKAGRVRPADVGTCRPFKQG